MDLIINLANKFVHNYMSMGVNNYHEIIDQATNKVSEIDNHLDRIKYLNVILEANNKLYQEHLAVCKNPIDCTQNFSHQNISYFLKQKLSRLGVQINSDAFTPDEKRQTDSRLDEILKDLSALKAGQQVIYEDLQTEIEELRNLYFMGKKNWYQLLVGKSIEMVAAGIISDSVSKQIITSFKHSFQNLLPH